MATRLTKNTVAEVRPRPAWAGGASKEDGSPAGPSPFEARPKRGEHLRVTVTECRYAARSATEPARRAPLYRGVFDCLISRSISLVCSGSQLNTARPTVTGSAARTTRTSSWSFNTRSRATSFVGGARRRREIARAQPDRRTNAHQLRRNMLSKASSPRRRAPSPPRTARSPPPGPTCRADRR